MTLDVNELYRRLLQRLRYIDKKQSYSTKEKEIRSEEIRSLIDYLDGFRVVKRERLKWF